MSDKRFNIHRSRGNQGQSFGVTTIKKAKKKKLKSKWAGEGVGDNFLLLRRGAY